MHMFCDGHHELKLNYRGIYLQPISAIHGIIGGQNNEEVITSIGEC